MNSTIDTVVTGKCPRCRWPKKLWNPRLRPTTRKSRSGPVRKVVALKGSTSNWWCVGDCCTAHSEHEKPAQALRIGCIRGFVLRKFKAFGGTINHIFVNRWIVLINLNPPTDRRSVWGRSTDSWSSETPKVFEPPRLAFSNNGLSDKFRVLLGDRNCCVQRNLNHIAKFSSDRPPTFHFIPRRNREHLFDELNETPMIPKANELRHVNIVPSHLDAAPE